MPTFMRAYFFILIALGLASVFFITFFKGKIFVKWIVLWFFVTTLAFLSRHILVFTCVLSFVFLLIQSRSPIERSAVYCVLLPAIPSYFGYEIPGLVPGVRYLFLLSYPRILALTILLPIFLQIAFNPTQPKRIIFSLGTDIPVILYLILVAALSFRAPSLTEALRRCVMLFLDIFLIYYVVSRAVQRSEDLPKIFWAFLFSAVMLSFAGMLEEVKRWTFYNHITDALSLTGLGFGQSLYRSGILRICGTFGQPIVFGFFIVIGMGSLIYLWEREKRQPLFWCVCLAFFVLVLVFTVSRGPWLGAVVFFMAWLLQIRHSKKIRALVVITGCLMFFMPILTSTVPGQRILKVLPYFGTQEQDTIDFREELLDAGIESAKKNPWFGSTDYMESEGLKSLERGGLIDITNTFLGVALNSGFVGASLFILIFIKVLMDLLRWSLRAKHKKREDVATQGKILFALVLATLVILCTVSSITLVPHYYWLLIALSAAYVNIAKKELARA